MSNPSLEYVVAQLKRRCKQLDIIAQHVQRNPRTLRRIMNQETKPSCDTLVALHDFLKSVVRKNTLS